MLDPTRWRDVEDQEQTREDESRVVYLQSSSCVLALSIGPFPDALRIVAVWPLVLRHLIRGWQNKTRAPYVSGSVLLQNVCWHFCFALSLVHTGCVSEIQIEICLPSVLQSVTRFHISYETR